MSTHGLPNLIRKRTVVIPGELYQLISKLTGNPCDDSRAVFVSQWHTRIVVRLSASLATCRRRPCTR